MLIDFVIFILVDIGLRSCSVYFLYFIGYLLVLLIIFLFFYLENIDINILVKIIYILIVYKIFFNF